MAQMKGPIPPKPPALNPIPVGKDYMPHIIIISISDDLPSQVKEFPNYDDALQMYLNLVEVHPRKLILAKVVRQHGEG